MRLILIRHGEPDYALDSLTERGWWEAELLSRRLAHLKNIEGIYCSPRGRALDTAAPTLRALRREAEVLPWLAEFRGRAWDPDRRRTGVCWDMMPHRWQADPLLNDPLRWTESPLLAGSGADTVWEETKAGLDALLARHGYVREGGIWRCAANHRGELLLFCHFGIATAIAGDLMGIAPPVLWHTMLMLPSAVTVFVTEERVPGEVVWRCEAYGDTGHLYAGATAPSTAGLFPETYNGRDTTDPDEWMAL